MQGPVTLLGQELVGLDHGDDVVVLDGDLEVVEAALLEQARLPHGRLDQGLGGGLAVLLEQTRVQGTGVDADAQGDTGVRGGLADLLDLTVELADVARVDAHGAAAGLDGLEDVLGVEVDVRDDGDTGLLGDDRQGLSVLVRGAGHAHDVAARCRQLGDLLEGGADVMGLGGGHRLHRDGSIPAHLDVTDPDLAGGAAQGQNRALLAHSRNTKSDRLSHGVQYGTTTKAPDHGTERSGVGSSAPASQDRSGAG